MNVSFVSLGISGVCRYKPYRCCERWPYRQTLRPYRFYERSASCGVAMDNLTLDSYSRIFIKTVFNYLNEAHMVFSEGFWEPMSHHSHTVIGD